MADNHLDCLPVLFIKTNKALYISIQFTNLRSSYKELIKTVAKKVLT